MTILAIIGCGSRLELALGSPSLSSPGLVALAGPTPRSELVLAGVDLLMRAAGLTPASLSAVGATRGPGSFTGVRVALATAQGLAQALAIPARGVASLVVQAARSSVFPCLALQPARRGQVYAQPFESGPLGPRPLAEPEVRSLDSLVDTRHPLVAPPGVVLPSGARVAAATITTAEALLALLERDPNLGGDGDLLPLYLEPPPAMPPRSSR